MKAILFLFFISFFSPIFSQDKNQEPFMMVDQIPEFPGGDDALTVFISKSIKYPKKAVKAEIEGTVYIQFVIRPDGSISNVKVIKSVSKLLDKEAIRVVKSMPKWKPGKQGGKAVPVYFDLPISFQLTD